METTTAGAGINTLCCSQRTAVEESYERKASRPTTTCDLLPSERSFLDEMRRLGPRAYESLRFTR